MTVLTVKAAPRKRVEAQPRRRLRDAWKALCRLALEETDPRRDDGRRELARLGLVAEHLDDD